MVLTIRVDVTPKKNQEIIHTFYRAAVGQVAANPGRYGQRLGIKRMKPK